MMHMDMGREQQGARREIKRLFSPRHEPAGLVLGGKSARDDRTSSMMIKVLSTL